MHTSLSSPFARRRSWRWLAALLALLGFAMLGAASAAPVAQGSVGTDPTNSLQPQVAADSANNLHVVWYDGGNERGVKYAKGSWDGARYSWSSIVDIYRPGGSSTFVHPRIAIDRNDTVHLVWTWNDTIYYRSWPVSGGPGQGTGPQALGSGVYAAVAVDGNSHVHVAWESQLANFEILYREGVNNQFGGAQNLSNNAGDSLSPDIAVDSRGVVQLAWYDKTPGVAKVFYSYRVPEGWAAPAIISGDDSVFPGLATDAQGCTHMAWNQVSNDTIVYRKSCNGQLGGPVVVGNNASPRRGTVGVNNVGNALVAWDSRASGPINLFYSLFDGNGWTGQAAIAPSGNSQLWADVRGLPNGNLVVVWEENINGQFDPAYAVVAVIPPAPTPPPAPPATPTPAPGAETAPPPANGDYAAPQFRTLWERTDLPVAAGKTTRSWLWGPGPITGAHREPYLNSPDGARLVQYFDKSRMEINDPGQPRVSNGLLVVEMISGRVQVGDGAFRDRGPAEQALAGDRIEVNAAAPTYATFRQVAFPVNQARAASRVGQTVTATITRAGQVGDNAELGRYKVTVGTYDQALGHNVPKVFVDFFNQRGPIYEGGYTQGPVIDALFAVGLPISEPFWGRVKLGGVEQDVLIQAFERRVLTYTPSNPAAFKVEMGNVGQHYLRWRYGQ